MDTLAANDPLHLCVCIIILIHLFTVQKLLYFSYNHMHSIKDRFSFALVHSFHTLVGIGSLIFISRKPIQEGNGAYPHLPSFFMLLLGFVLACSVFIFILMLIELTFHEILQFFELDIAVANAFGYIAQPFIYPLKPRRTEPELVMKCHVHARQVVINSPIKGVMDNYLIAATQIIVAHAHRWMAYGPH